jgi:hypothetical protein
VEHRLAFKEYNEALKENRLLALKCSECEAITVPPKMLCRNCASEKMEVIELGGGGVITTFTTVNVAPEGREEEVPYIVVMVGLDEGPWVMGNLTGIGPDGASMELIGKRVEMGHTVFSGDKFSAGESTSPLFRLTA